jgi:hypothetical protein
MICPSYFGFLGYVIMVCSLVGGDRHFDAHLLPPCDAENRGIVFHQKHGTIVHVAIGHKTTL